jgi:Transposase DDE domain group 1
MRYGPKHLRVEYSGNQLTHFGGVYLLHGFFRQLNLRRLLSQRLRVRRRNAMYSVAETLLAILYPTILGVGRLQTTELLRRNGVFQTLTGLGAYPTPSTLRRFLMRTATAALPKLRELHAELRTQMIQRPAQPTQVIFDLDSTVLPVYGTQIEQARVGYNPRKRGRPSYHPLLCFEGATRDYWHGELRSGDAHTAKGAAEFLDVCFATLPATVRKIRVRADKGFFDHRLIERIEAHHARFVIVARITKPIQLRLSGLTYTPVTHSDRFAVAEFSYQPHGWKQPYRFVVIRRALPHEPAEQVTLFTLGRYAYQVMVTNLGYRPVQIWHFYNARAAMELIIRELKSDYPLAKIPTQSFAANEFYFHLLLFAYNLTNWMKRLCLPEEYQAMTLATLRTHLLLVPGILIRSGRRLVLKLPPWSSHEATAKYALKRMRKLSLRP